MNSFEDLIKKIDNAKDLSFSDLFDSIIELFKKLWIKGLLAVLIIVGFAFAVNMVFSLIGLAPKNNFFLEDMDFNSFFSSYSKTALLSIPQTILLTTLSMCVLSAFYRICKHEVLGQNVTDDYFYFFKKEYFSKLLMLGIIHTAIAVVAQFLFIIPYIYVFVPLSYITMVFANNPHLSEAEIVKASFKLGHKKWLLTFGALFVTGVLGGLGVIACFVGLFFTISIVYLPVFFIYKDVVGFDAHNDIEQIGVRDDSDY